MLPEQSDAARRRLRKFAPSGLLLLAALLFIAIDAARWGFVSYALVFVIFCCLLSSQARSRKV